MEEGSFEGLKNMLVYKFIQKLISELGFDSFEYDKLIENVRDAVNNSLKYDTRDNHTITR